MTTLTQLEDHPSKIKPHQSLAEMRAFVAERKAKIAEIEAEISSFVTALHFELGLTNVEYASDRSTRKTKRHAKSTRNSKKEEVADAARQLIEARGEPIPRSELHNLLVEQGLRISGTDPEMVLSTMLWRMRDQVIRIKTGGYWIAGRALPEGYQA